MKDYRLVKTACYATNVTMSIVTNLSPLLFLTFHRMYGVSYTLLGMLVLINFVTQLGIDLVFSFFAHRFNIPLTVKLTPWIGACGLIQFALAPFIFPGAVYLGLVVGTVVFSAACGLAEVLMSPVIAAIPSENPDREMSKLHSIYAWGVVGMILVATVLLLLVGDDGWMVLPLVFSLVPLLAGVLFLKSEIPPMETPEKASGALQMFRQPGLWLSVLAIFFGGASECTMAQWSSGYLEQALGIPKVWGDIFGVALFGLMLALGRTMYAKWGKHMERILVAGFAASIGCYLICALTSLPLVGLLSCAFTGFCASMLWPGNLVIAADRFPKGGVFIYAIMAAGGDLGASVGPQLVGIVTDVLSVDPQMIAMAEGFGLSPDQFGLKCGLLIAAVFPLCGLMIAIRFLKSLKKTKSADNCA